MSPSATPATQSEGRCHQGPRLLRKVRVDVAKCHACHANGRGDHGGKRDPSASPEPAQCHKCHACHASVRWMSPSATPVTQNEGGCHQVPRLPRKVPRVGKLCVGKLCVLVSCVWVSCVCVWVHCVCVSKLCVGKLCVGLLCVCELCV